MSRHIILCHALALVILAAQIVLTNGKPLVRRPPIPSDGFGIVLRYALA